MTAGDGLDALLRSLPPLGAWTEHASCADLGAEGAAIFTSDKPEPEGLAVAEAICWRCPVRGECRAYAEGVPSWGLWGADWFSGKGSSQRAA